VHAGPADSPDQQAPAPVSAQVLCAQSTNASLTGRVTDPSHALIAVAKVAAISTDTDARYATLANASGEYSAVSPGIARRSPQELETGGRC